MTPACQAIAAVSATFGVPTSAIVGPSRKRSISFARFAVYALLKERGWTTPQIGAALGLDHSSVVHGQQRAGEMDDAWRGKFDAARERMSGKAIPAWRVVYAKPIGPPEAPREKVAPEPVAPKRPTHDDVWAAIMRGARFRSVRAPAEGAYRDALPDCAREIS